MRVQQHQSVASALKCTSKEKKKTLPEAKKMVIANFLVFLCQFGFCFLHSIRSFGVRFIARVCVRRVTTFSLCAIHSRTFNQFRSEKYVRSLASAWTSNEMNTRKVAPHTRQSTRNLLWLKRWIHSLVRWTKPVFWEISSSSECDNRNLNYNSNRFFSDSQKFTIGFEHSTSKMYKKKNLDTYSSFSPGV